MFKQTLKGAIGRAGRFILSNLVSFAIYLIPWAIYMFVYFAMKDQLSEEMLNMFVNLGYLICTLSLGFTLYKYFFMPNHDFKNHFRAEREVGKSVEEIMKSHLLKFGRIDIVWLLVIALVISLVPKSMQGIGLLVGSAVFFEAIVPIRIIAALLWMIYVAATYFICMRYYYIKLENDRLEYENKYKNTEI